MRAFLKHTRFAVLAMLISFGVVMAAYAESEPLPGPIPARVERIVDGDTLGVEARIWPGQSVVVLVRLDGVDAPELRRARCDAERRAGELARDYWASLKDTEITLVGVRHGRYAGRVVAQVRDARGVDLGETLLREGLAVPYGEPKPWCAHRSAQSRSP